MFGRLCAAFIVILFFIVVKAGFDEDVLRVVAEFASKEGHTAHIVGLLLDADAHIDRIAFGKFEVVDGDGRAAHPIDVRAVAGDFPELVLAVLRALGAPPIGGKQSAFAAVVGGAAPGADLNAVNPDRDVGRPFEIMQRSGRAGFKADFERIEVDVVGNAVGETVFNMPLMEPQHLRIDMFGFKERSGVIELSDDADLAEDAAGGGDFNFTEGTNRHGDFYAVLFGMEIGGELDDELVKITAAHTAQSARGGLELGLEQAGFFEQVDMLGGGGNGKVECFGNLEDRTGLIRNEIEDRKTLDRTEGFGDGFDAVNLIFVGGQVQSPT